MKRFGYPVLLSAVYVTAMILLFSSNYSKENSFLYPTAPADSLLAEPAESSPEVPEVPVSTVEPVTLKETDSPISLPKTNPSPATPVVDSDHHHSPESSEVE